MLFGVAVVLALATAGRFYLVSWLGERVTADVRSAVYRHVISMSPQYFETTQTGEVLSRLTTDTTLVQTVIGTSLSMGLRNVLLMLGGLVMLAMTSPSLTGYILVTLLLVVLPIVLFGRRVRALSKSSQDRIADSSAMAGEVLNAIPTVQAFNQQAAEAKRFVGSVELSFGTALARIRARSLLTVAVIMLIFRCHRVRAVAGRAASAGRADERRPAGAVHPVCGGDGRGDWRGGRGMGRCATRRRGHRAADGAAATGLAGDRTAQPMPADGRALAFAAGQLCLPSRPEQPSLSQIDLELAPGEHVALVGPSGAGKSTLFQLLLRFYDPQQGQISLGGIDIRQLALADLRQHIGVVLQDSVIFGSSALENIRYGRPDATDEEVHAAARAAAAHDFIQALPQGYATYLGERGVRLSGGQRQRIAIARAILKNPPILLLDEATSALDAESEQLVQGALERAAANRTTLVIAHRLATVKEADRIVVLEGGRIVAQGRHEELLHSSPLYARLAALQFAAGSAGE
jgi:ATP-binding cassette subfamily B protein